MARRRRLKFEIGIDGGVNEDTVRRVVAAGADHLIIGSAIFQRDGIGRRHCAAARVDRFERELKI